MQITTRLVRSEELSGLEPAEIYERLRVDQEEDEAVEAFSEIEEADEAWLSDSMILHQAFSEDVDGSEAATPFLRGLVTAINDVDDLAMRELPESEGTIAGSLSLATVTRQLTAWRQDNGRSWVALKRCEPEDDGITPDDFVDYFDQWMKTLEIAERHEAAIIIHVG